MRDALWQGRSSHRCLPSCLAHSGRTRAPPTARRCGICFFFGRSHLAMDMTEDCSFCSHLSLWRLCDFGRASAAQAWAVRILLAGGKHLRTCLALAPAAAVFCLEPRGVIPVRCPFCAGWHSQHRADVRAQAALVTASLFLPWCVFSVSLFAADCYMASRPYGAKAVCQDASS
jgi:hypothetical protein